MCCGIKVYKVHLFVKILLFVNHEVGACSVNPAFTLTK